MSGPTDIRPASPRDADQIWRILQAVVAAGDTFPLDPEITREEGLGLWMGAHATPGLAAASVEQSSGRACHVAEVGGVVVGSYTITPNQPGLGSHVANASFMVAPESRGLGVGRAMGEHALAEARRLGFRAMQFNMVVSTNTAGIALWRKLGFEVIGRVPNAFHLRRERHVDVLIMHRSLDA